MAAVVTGRSEESAGLPLARPATPASESGEPVTEAPPLRTRLIGFGGWAVYLTLIVLAIALGPAIMRWALDSQYPVAAVSGNSMWPALKQGDVVLLKGVSNVDDLKVGDIIGFRHPNGMAIHRIVRIEHEKITTRGDANFTDDPPIGLVDVIGKVPNVAGIRGRIPFLGNVSFLLGPLIKGTDEGVAALPADTPLATPESPAQ